MACFHLSSRRHSSAFSCTPSEPAIELGKLRARAFGEGAVPQAEMHDVVEALRAAFMHGRAEGVSWTGEFERLEQLVQRAGGGASYREATNLEVERQAFELLRELADTEALPSFELELPRRLEILRPRRQTAIAPA